jgi:hypothetical protein
VKRVIAHQPPNRTTTTEERWYRNIHRLLQELDLNGEIHLETLYDEDEREEGDVFFLFKTGHKTDELYDLDDRVRANKRIFLNGNNHVHGVSLDQYHNIPSNSIFCDPYRVYGYYSHGGYSSKFRRAVLPAIWKRTESDNWNKPGLLLTIKAPAASYISQEAIKARLEHFKMALTYHMQGTKVTVLYRHLMRADAHPNHNEMIDALAPMFSMVGAHDFVSGEEMDKLISEHSIVYTGKVYDSRFNGSIIDSLSLGSVPVIWNDFQEKLFHEDIDMEYSYQNLNQYTYKLLNNEMFYQEELLRLQTALLLPSKNNILDTLRLLIEEP